MAFLVSFFGAVGILLGWMQAAERASQDRDWQAVMDPRAADPGLAPADDVPTDRARRVTVGLYLERITEVAKTFHIHNFPLDRHLLVLAFEDGSGQREKLLFEPDVVNSDISSRAAVHGYRLGALTAVEKPHSYKTTQGRPGLAPGTRSTFSQARFGLVIARDSWGPFVKMFHALFVAVAIALLPRFIRPTDLDPRFGLGVGALFAAVAHAYLIGALVPDTGEFSLADLVNLLGIVTILITLVESTVSLHLFDHCGQQDLSLSLDRTSFVVVSVGFVAAVALILLGASGRLWP